MHFSYSRGTAISPFIREDLHFTVLPPMKEFPMKSSPTLLIAVSVLLTSAFAATSGQAKEIRSDDRAAQGNIGRVVRVIPLVRKENPDASQLFASIAVRDHGGSTD